jgi:hypothetical protein
MTAYVIRAAITACGAAALIGCTTLSSKPPVVEPKRSEPDRSTDVEVVAQPVEQQTAEEDTPDAAVSSYVERVLAASWPDSQPSAEALVESAVVVDELDDGSAEAWSDSAAITSAEGVDLEPVGASAPASDDAGATTNADEPAAPALVNVSVRAVRHPPQEAPPTPESPQPNVPVESSTRASLSELAERWLARPMEESFRDQLERRLLRVLIGDYEGARQPMTLVADAQRDAAQHFVEALIRLHESHGGEPAREAARVLEALERSRAALASASELSLPAVVLCRSVLGYGLYEPLDPPHLRCGQPADVIAYCEVRNLAVARQTDSRYETLIDVRTALLTAAGDVVQQAESSGIRTQWRDERHECFIAPVISLPASLAPGEYVLKLTVADRIGNKVAEQRATLRLVASP